MFQKVKHDSHNWRNSGRKQNRMELGEGENSSEEPEAKEKRENKLHFTQYQKNRIGRIFTDYRHKLYSTRSCIYYISIEHMGNPKHLTTMPT
jgi:hypothetical protein